MLTAHVRIESERNFPPRPDSPSGRCASIRAYRMCLPSLDCRSVTIVRR